MGVIIIVARLPILILALPSLILAHDADCLGDGYSNHPTTALVWKAFAYLDLYIKRECGVLEVVN
jgi:hypothetical protein